MKVIGSADEFWRLRITRVDATDAFDFEWHEDILYRQPVTQPVEELELWHVDAVRVDDRETKQRLATFAEREPAEQFLAQALEDLTEMTKSQFEQTYLSDAPATPDAEEA